MFFLSSLKASTSLSYVVPGAVSTWNFVEYVSLEIHGPMANTLNKKAPSQTVSPPEELVSTFFRWADPPDAYRGFVCLPYIKGLTEPLMRLLRNKEIRVVSKAFKTLQQEFPSPKFRQPMDLQTNVVHKIPCSDCSWNYIGESGRCFQTWKKEHKRNLKNHAKGSNIANHAW